jgi:hypothetical protein
MRHAFRLISRGVLFVLLSATLAWAQAAATAQINGTIRDPGGLGLPGATVTVTNTDTGLTRTTVADASGSFILQNLPIGPYRFEAALQGFRTYVQTGIVLQVGANPTLTATLPLGQLEETVTVAASAQLVETRNPGIGQVITNQQVLELPLNGRQLTELVFQAGLATGGKGTGDAPGGNILNTGVRSYPNTTIVVAGGLSNGMTYILDGGTHNDPFNNLGLPLPFPDAMQEFKVETSALPAQYGHHSAAAVNAVTKSGTNVLHGGLFEFMRDDSLNATNAFASIDENGKRRSDGLHRDQFGGTIGGPIVAGRLFYFGGYQGTNVEVTPASFFQFVPTPAMLAGDFSAFTSPACNGGRTIALRAPFVDNRVSPSLYSPAAINLAGRLPQPANDCGQSFFSRKTSSREHIAIGRVDFQWSNSHSIFGRYQLAQYEAEPDNDPENVLAYANGPIDDTITSLVVGDTHLFGSNTVNSFRVTYNSTDIRKDYVPFFDAATLGVRNIATPLPGFTAFNISGGFNLGPTGAKPSVIPTKAFQFVDDFSLVRGAHQIGVGVNFIHSSLDSASYGSAAGQFNFTGAVTGSGMADFLLGRFNNFVQGQVYYPAGAQNYVGAYVQDAWRVTPKLTLNVGVRWDPYMPYYSDNGTFNHFSLEQFRAGVRSTRFRNAPAGVVFEGDPQYTPGNSVGETYLAAFAPRLAGVYDPVGDGRMTLRAAWGRFYDLPHIWNFLGFDRGTPFGTELEVTNGTFDDPWVNTPGGNPFPFTVGPDVAFPLYGGFLSFPLEMKPPYSDQWNVSVQRQLGAASMVSVNYLSNRGRRLPVGDQLNPAVYSPGATTATTNQRRQLSLENPADGRFYGRITGVLPVGTSEYQGLLVSAQHRSSNGLFVSGNYTLSTCESDVVNYEPSVAGLELTKPGDPEFDRGSCGITDQRHVVNMSAVYQVPGTGGGVLGALTSDWQVSAIVSARSGTHFSATTGVDNALNGQANQRPNKVSDDVYRKEGYRWLDPAAFRAPAAGTFGDLENNSLVGPGRFNVDMGLTRAFRIAAQHQIQFRAEVFNVFNRVHLNNPVSTLNSPNFGLITSAGDPRIVQLALKYIF